MKGKKVCVGGISLFSSWQLLEVPKVISKQLCRFRNKCEIGQKHKDETGKRHDWRSSWTQADLWQWVLTCNRFHRSSRVFGLEVTGNENKPGHTQADVPRNQNDNKLQADRQGSDRQEPNNRCNVSAVDWTNWCLKYYKALTMYWLLQTDPPGDWSMDQSILIWHCRSFTANPEFLNLLCFICPQEKFDFLIHPHILFLCFYFKFFAIFLKLHLTHMALELQKKSIKCK